MTSKADRPPEIRWTLESMDPGLIDPIRSHLSDKPTEELVEIYRAHDPEAWSEESFEAIRQILTSRGVSVPKPARPSAAEGICQACGYDGPRRFVRLYRLSLNRRTCLEAHLCRACIRGYFWRYTSVSLAMGWWGVPSLLINPLLILGNIAYCISSLGMRQPRFPHLASVRHSLAALYRHFSAEHIRLFFQSVDRESLLAAAADRREESELFAGRVARALVHFLSLKTTGIQVTFTENLGAAGRVHPSPTRHFDIAIDCRYIGRKTEIAAILAHEIMHEFLFDRGLVLENPLENEYLTDTAAAYLGIGWMMLDAYRTTTVRSDRERSKLAFARLGYLTPWELGYVLAKRASLFREKPEVRLTSPAALKAYRIGRKLARSEWRTPPLSRSALLSRLAYLWRRSAARARGASSVPIPDRKTGYAFEANGGAKVVFKCPVCCQRLRVPAYKGPIEARCGVCAASLSCRT